MLSLCQAYEVRLTETNKKTSRAKGMKLACFRNSEKYSVPAGTRKVKEQRKSPAGDNYTCPSSNPPETDAVSVWIQSEILQIQTLRKTQ